MTTVIENSLTVTIHDTASEDVRTSVSTNLYASPDTITLEVAQGEDMMAIGLFPGEAVAIAGALMAAAARVDPQDNEE